MLCQLLSEQVAQTPQSSFGWSQIFCSCAHLYERLTETLCIYSVQMLSSAVETYAGNSTINALLHIIVKFLTLVFQREEELNSTTAVWQN